MPDTSTILGQYVEKLLLHRGQRGIVCRVFPPTAGLQSYSVLLEGQGVREQFSLDAGHVETFARTRNEQFVLTEIRTALRNLERHAAKRKASRRG